MDAPGTSRATTASDGEHDRLTRRALGKATWPGVWTNSFCGHPGPGESPAEAVLRRAGQELGMAVRDVRPVLPDFRYVATDASGLVENEVCPVYVARCPDPDGVSPDPTEVAELEWVDWTRFRSDALSGRREISPWCRLQLDALPPVL